MTRSLPGNPDAVRELDVQGVYRVGPVSVVEDRFVKPNELVFSPDESLLYIVDSSEERRIWRYEMQADGSLGDRALFADMRDDERTGVPDVMTNRLPRASELANSRD